MSERTVASLIAALTEQSYRLEVVGEAVAVEAREVRHAASKLIAIDERLRSEGSEYDDYASAQAALEKLRQVENDVRHQAEIIRDLAGNI